MRLTLLHKVVYRRTMRRTWIVTGICFLAACGRKNNLLLGRVEGAVGGHTVVVTDCYRVSAPAPQRLADEGGRAVWRYMPCRDADIRIRGESLTVNGREYGRLNPSDSVLVDHGVVSIGRRGAARQAAPSRSAPLAAQFARTPPHIRAFFARRRIVQIRRSASWRKASRRIKRCTAWCERFVASLSSPAERRA